MLFVFLKGHVSAGFPYISDTGKLPPESCIFGLMLNFCAMFSAICLYIRYIQVMAYNQFDRVLLRLNRASLVCGLLGCLVCTLRLNVLTK